MRLPSPASTNSSGVPDTRHCRFCLIPLTNLTSSDSNYLRRRPSFCRLSAGAFSPIAVARPDCTLETLADTAEGRPGTQGIRIPQLGALLEILRATGPLAASSANRSGDESAQTVDEAVEAFGNQIDLYLDWRAQHKPYI